MKKKKLYVSFMIVFAFIILLNFAIHVYRTNAFNNQKFFIDEENQEQDYTFDLRPTNGKDISWTRTASINGESIDLYACSFEGIFDNLSEIEVSDWTLKADIRSDCYLNSAWCGIVEVHQNVLTDEKVQTLDLRNLEASKIELEFYEDGDITLFPLKSGDYLIYYPDEGAKEKHFAANAYKPAQVSIGIIIYWNQNDEFVSPGYEIEYQKHKNYFQGKESIIFVVTSIIWLLFLVAGVAVSITMASIRKKEEIEKSKRDIEQKTTEMMLDEMIKALASSIDAKDAYTHGHSERVAQYALMLAKALDLSPKECKEIFYAGLVHDVGKIAIPDGIINKPGKLTDEEFAVIKSHPLRGEKILSKIEKMPYLAVGAKYHHERYDGNGYPCHVKGEDLPLSARIIAVADSYDAMTSQRSYRKTLDQRIVKQEIWKGIGTQFDPLVAKHMIAMIDADADYKMRQTMDEKYEIIDEISSSEFWEEYDPKSIKSEEKIMSDTSIKYFGEFVSMMDHWSNPIRLMEVSSDVFEAKIFSKSLDDAEYIWNAPTVILYSADDGNPQGENYTELAVFMCAGYSWKTGPSLYEENSFTRKDTFADWKNWLSRNKEGMEYQFRINKKNNSIYLQIDNELMSMEGMVKLPEDYNKRIYLSVTGEKCQITI